MSDTAVETQATPDGSLETAATAMESILTRQKADTQKPTKTEPEQQAKKEEEPATQAPAAPSEAKPADESEPAKVEAPEVKLHKLKLGEEEVEVPEDEVLRGYLRTADYTRKTQELAKQRKEFEEGELRAAREHRAAQQSALDQLKGAIESINPKEPDWNTLRGQVSPEEYNAKRADWFDRKDALDRIAAEQTRLKAEQDAEAQQGFASYVAEQRASLERELPEFKDPEKGPALQKDLVSFAKARGFADEEIAQVVDHRVLLLLHDAMQGQKARDAAKQKTAEIKTKVEKAIEAAAPGTAQPAPKKSAKDEAFLKAAKSGSDRDAAKFFEHLIN